LKDAGENWVSDRGKLGREMKPHEVQLAVGKKMVQGEDGMDSAKA